MKDYDDEGWWRPGKIDFVVQAIVVAFLAVLSLLLTLGACYWILQVLGVI